MLNTNEDILLLEGKKCFDFFWNEANTDKTSPGYGLIKDNTSKGMSEMASIASVGFGLSAIIIGIENGWITKEEGYERTKGTLKTFLTNVEAFEGFFYHFIEMSTGKKYGENYDCPSIIDTSIFLNGAITSAEYFDNDIRELVNEIYEQVNWPIYYDEARNVFFMGYYPETGGFGEWDIYAEQMMQYLLAVGSPTHPVDRKIYDGFDRTKVKYGDYEFCTSPGNPLFVHQFSHAWFDFSRYDDKDGNNWAENSRQATLAQRQYAIDNPKNFKTFHEHSWGLTACDGPYGYRVYGGEPFRKGTDAERNDGTVAPTAASGSLVFTPQESIDAMNHFYHEVPELWGEYGFKDAYNLDVDPPFYTDSVIGIDKGITLLMIENYRSGLIWELYMKSPMIQKAIEELQFKKVGEQ